MKPGLCTNTRILHLDIFLPHYLREYLFWYPLSSENIKIIHTHAFTNKILISFLKK